MIQRIVFVLALVLLPMAKVLAVAQTDNELSRSVSGAIEIDVDGRVTGVEIKEQLPGPLASAVDDHIRQWRFEPIEVDGRVVSARTRLSLWLYIDTTEDERIVLRFGNPTFGAPTVNPDSMRGEGRIRYPTEMARHKAGARVLVVARIDADGRIVDVHPYQTSLDVEARGGTREQRMREAFERAALSAIRNWRYELHETVGDETLDMDVIVPVDFEIVSGPGAIPKRGGEWRALNPGPVNPAPWHDQVPDEEELARLEGGQAAALDSRFRLIE